MFSTLRLPNHLQTSLFSQLARIAQCGGPMQYDFLTGRLASKVQNGSFMEGAMEWETL